jgi:hypothetical protein
MQIAPVYGVLVEDVNGDGNLDFIAVGNSYAPDVVSGRCDAFTGQVMLGDGKGSFRAVPVTRSGFFVSGDSKGIAHLRAGRDLLTVVTQNNDSLKFFRKSQANSLKPLIVKKMEMTALVTFNNGRSLRMEIGYGSTYLSQTSRSISITPEIKKIQLWDATGKTTRTIDY